MLPAGGNTTDYKSPSFLAIDNYGRRPNLRYKPTSSKFLRIAHTYTIQIPSYGSYNHRNRNIRCPYKPAYVSNRRKCDRQSAYGVVQIVGGKYWDPSKTFGEKVAQGQLKADDEAGIQAALDELVEGVSVPAE